MLGPNVLYDKNRLIKYLFIVSFTDVVKAKIKFGYSAWNKTLYKKKLINKLISSAKSIRFLHVCKQIVLVQFKFDFNSNSLENLEFDAETAMALILILVRAKELIKANEFTINN